MAEDSCYVKDAFLYQASYLGVMGMEMYVLMEMTGKIRRCRLNMIWQKKWLPFLFVLSEAFLLQHLLLDDIKKRFKNTTQC